MGEQEESELSGNRGRAGRRGGLGSSPGRPGMAAACTRPPGLAGPCWPPERVGWSLGFLDRKGRNRPDGKLATSRGPGGHRGRVQSRPPWLLLRPQPILVQSLAWCGRPRLVPLASSKKHLLSRRLAAVTSPWAAGLPSQLPVEEGRPCVEVSARLSAFSR